MPDPCRDCGSAECPYRREGPVPHGAENRVVCLQIQLAAAKAENERLMATVDAVSSNARTLNDWGIELTEKLGPVYSLLEGHSVSERGTLTNSEGGILQARNVWTLADLQRAEALAVGAQCKLDGDEVWIRREE